MARPAVLATAASLAALLVGAEGFVFGNNDCERFQFCSQYTTDESVDSRYIGGAVRFATGAPPNVSDSTAPLATVDTPAREDVLRNVRIGQPTDDAPFAFSMRLVDSDGTGSPLSGWYACSTHLIVAVTVNTHMATCVANWDREENSSAPAYYQLQIDVNEDDEVCAVTRLTAVGYAPELRAVGYTGGIPMNWWVKNCGD